VNIVKQNATIDWTIGEHVQAKMRLAVKRIRNKYGYPPEAQSLTELSVMETVKAIAAEPSRH